MSSMHEFKILSGAELGSCSNMGSFRAITLRDNRPILLHRFRPGEMFTPVIRVDENPDFHSPFVTGFTSFFKTTGSIYLVEPLPCCISLADAWRSILINVPEYASDFIGALVKQLSTILISLVNKGLEHGGVCLGNIVLTQNSAYGLLVNKLDTQNGFISLRPAKYPDYHDDFTATGQVLLDLLNIEAAMSLIHSKPIIENKLRNAIQILALTINDSEDENHVYS